MSEQTESTPSRLPILIAVFATVGVVMALGLVLSSRSNPNNALPTPRPARIAGGQSAVEGWEVPDFEIQLYDGETKRLSDYRGQVVFLNFWATWCVPCQREMPAFESFMEEEPDKAIILAVNNGEDSTTIGEFLNLFQLDDLPIVLDEGFVISDGFGIVNLPVTYVLDGEGVVRGFHLGEITREDIDSYLTSISG